MPQHTFAHGQEPIRVIGERNHPQLARQPMGANDFSEGDEPRGLSRGVAYFATGLTAGAALAMSRFTVFEG